MGFNRQPHYTRSLMLLGDGGMVNPFNGEGIPYAMESGVRRRGRRPGAAPAAEPARTRVDGSVPEGAEAGVRRLLHARPDLREADRKSGGDAAVHEYGLPLR